MVIEYQEMVTPHESRDLPAETLLNLRESGKCQESPPAARATSATKKTLRKCSLSEWMNAVLARVLRSRKGDAKSRQWATLHEKSLLQEARGPEDKTSGAPLNLFMA